ncbi:hypothetical protein SAMN06265353_0973 [Hydrogenobacter hydrogenophilus]|uniref:Uncharacterized protein n=1 Tax=Hydrogenobacter hydrogenophilus TaxID=35835 RepID=A0A285NXY2_9AQUI|nr:hypothetical protein SAMN06265353_0973 [Hydrogenobacter hydrogenophilus]
MKVLKVNDRRVAEKLRMRLLRKGMVVAEVYKEDDLKKDFVKKANVVLFVKNEEPQKRLTL